MTTLPTTGAYSTNGASLNIAPAMDGMYWGILVSTMLFGITISQAWTYANNNQDSWRLRSFVAFLILMDFAITCLNWQILRFYLMINFGNMSALLTVTKPWAACITLIEAVATLTEWFFVSRIYLLNKNSLWAPILACLLAIGGCVCLTLAVHSNFVHSSIYQLVTDYEKTLIGIGLGFTLSTVMLITAVLVVRLNNVHTSVKRTKSAVQKLLLFFVTRGLFVTLNQLAFLIVYEANDPLSMHWAPFLLLDPKLHVITMMAMLNSRHFSKMSDAGLVTSFASNRRTDPANLTTFTNQSGTSDTGTSDVGLEGKIDSTVGLARYKFSRRMFLP